MRRAGRQIDDGHDSGDLAGAGAAYALNAACMLYPFNGSEIEDPTLVGWPFEMEWWKPDLENPRRDLVRAAALIIAEIDRFDRAASTKSELNKLNDAGHFG